MKRTIKTILAAGLAVIALATGARAATTRYAEIRNSLQPDTTNYGVFLGSGTVQIFNASTATITTGSVTNLTVTASTITRANVTTGVVTGISGSTVTYSSGTFTNVTFSSTTCMIGTGNQVIFGTTTTTLDVVAPAAARNLHIQDVGVTDQYAMISSSFQAVRGRPFDEHVRGLKISWTSVATNHVLWDFAVLKDTTTGGVQISESTGTYIITINISGNGVNGLDTGTVKASTWYYIYLVGNGQNVGAVYSLSASTAPGLAMPSGYSYKKFVGSVKTDASSNIIESFNENYYTKWLAGNMAVVVSSAITTTATQRTDISTGSPPITAWAVDVYGFSSTQYSAAGGKGVALAVGTVGKTQVNLYDDVPYQDGVTAMQDSGRASKIIVINEPGANNKIDWSIASTSANRSSQNVWLYIEGYWEDINR